MPHYVAVIEEEGADKAVGIGFPICLAAFRPVTTSMKRCEMPRRRSASTRIRCRRGPRIPSPRPLSELRHDPEVAADIKNYMVALVAAPMHVDAAE